MFKLITQENHPCLAFSKRKEGSFECLSHHTQIKRAKSKLTDINNRQKHITALVEAFLTVNGKRLITLVGVAGVGKSAVAREAIHYVLQRRYFGGGVIHIDCKNFKSFEALENKLKNIMIKSLNMASSNPLLKRV